MLFPKVTVLIGRRSKPLRATVRTPTLSAVACDAVVKQHKKHKTKNISDTDWKQILSYNAVQFHAAPKRGRYIGKSIHKRDFSRGKVDLFLEPNTYQIFTQFSMFAFKGICQASWLDLIWALPEYGHFPDSSLSIFTREIVRIIHTLVSP